MKFAVDVKNMKKAISPSKGDVIMYDGKNWYITTKEDLFKEYQDKIDARIAEADRKLAEVDTFKAQISSQLIEMSEIIKKFVNSQGE